MQYSPSFTTHRGWRFTSKQLRASVVAVGGVGNHEALIVGELGGVEFLVERLGLRYQLAGPIQCGLQDVGQSLVIARVEITAVEPVRLEAFEI